jgi:NAD(P)H-dependent FMN reductase
MHKGLAISMTNRMESLTLGLAKEYVRRLTAKGLPTELYSLTELPPNFIAEEMYGRRSAAFKPVEDAVAGATFYLFVVPEYNGSFPGVGKAFIDAMPRDIWAGKTALLAGTASGRFGNVRGLDHLAGVLNYLQVSVLPFRAHFPYIESNIGPHGLSPEYETEIERQLNTLFAATSSAPII